MEPKTIDKGQQMAVDERGNWAYPSLAQSGHVEIELRMPIAQLSELAIVALRCDTKLACDLRAQVQANVSEGAAAAAAGVHGQPVVVVRLDVALGSKAMDLHVVLAEFEILCMQAGCDDQCRQHPTCDALAIHISS